MKPAAVILSALATMTAGCGDDGASSNPRVLWLFLDGRETEVKLVEDEPTPF